MLSNIYPSDYKDWIDPQSIIGVIYVLHADIGEACRAGRSNRDLLDDGVYHYNAKYYPSTIRGEYGYIEKSHYRILKVLSGSILSPQCPSKGVCDGPRPYSIARPYTRLQLT